MTTTTVEVEETRTIEEEVTLCDECQREIDENGERFTPPPMMDNSVELHFCSSCLNEMTDGEIRPEYIERAEDWLNYEWEGIPVDPNENPPTRIVREEVKGAAEMSQTLSAIGLLITLAIGVFAALGITIPTIAYVVYALGGLAAVILISIKLAKVMQVINNADAAFDFDEKT